MPEHQTGLLIIRTWLEQGSSEPLRAQIRVTGDISTGIERTLTLVGTDAVRELVDGWLEDFLALATV